MRRCERLLDNFSENEAVYITSYPNIFYYSGFTSEEAILVITKNRRILFTDSRYTIQAKSETCEFEIEDIEKKNAFIKELKEDSLCFEEDNLSVKEYEELKKTEKILKPATKLIKKPRRVKDGAELKKLADAEALADRAFSYILDRIKPGRSEKEIASELEFFMRKEGADRLSFDTICASGSRSAMPHGTASEKLIEKGDFLTLDFGCVLDGYCSDTTRTVVIKEASERQKEIYDVVYMAQNEALSFLKAGVSCKDADAAARNIIKNAGYSDNFAHATGHSVGIEIHELPSLTPKSNDILETGNVVTVEPGIYIEGFGGVRIEDLVQITSENALNLTKSEKKLLII